MSKLYYSGGTAPIFLADQDGCIYVQCRLAHQQMSFPFSVGKSTHTTYPGVSDSEKMIVDDISPETRTLLAQCQGRSPQEIATLIRAYILRTKKYSTKVQGTLHKKSNARNYITNLDRSPILECYSANTLFVALMRELGVPARIVLGHMAQGVSKE